MPLEALKVWKLQKLELKVVVNYSVGGRLKLAFSARAKVLAPLNH